MGRYILVVVMIIYLFSSLTSSKQRRAIQLRVEKLQRATEKKFHIIANTPNIIFSKKE